MIDKVDKKISIAFVIIMVCDICVNCQYKHVVNAHQFKNIFEINVNVLKEPLNYV